MFASIIIITLLFLIVLLLLLPRSVPRSEPTVYVIGREEWPASYWNWYGGYGGWGSRPHHRWTAGPGYKPADMAFYGRGPHGDGGHSGGFHGHH